MIDKLINLDMPVHINAGDIPAAIAELPRLVHQRDDARAEVARLTAELAAERAEVARLEAAAQRWIPVTERLPEEGIGVLIHGGETNALVGWFYGDKGWQDHAYDDIEGVTHWMPLPASPTSEEER